MLIKYKILAVTDDCGTYPPIILVVVVLDTFAVIPAYVLVFGEASGAEALSRPAINLSISDTSVFEVKLLK